VGDWVADGEGVWVGVMEADCVGVTDGLREELGDLVGVIVLLGDCVVLGLGVRDTDGDRDGVRVGVGDRDGVSEGLGVRDGVSEGLGVRDGVREMVGVREAGEAESHREQQAHGQVRPARTRTRTRTTEKEKENIWGGAHERVAGRRCRSRHSRSRVGWCMPLGWPCWRSCIGKSPS
jgi:hypothetical protein